MMTPLRTLLSILLFFGTTTPLLADRDLNSEKAKKLEVRHSMVGFRNTLLFYTFEDQQAILVLSIGNKDKSFPVTGKIHLFPKATSKDDIGKWINNQHSDGLFPEIPTPEFTQELPEGTAKVVSSKETGKSDNPGPLPGSFTNFDVEFKVKEYEVKGKFKLSEFSGTSKVHVKDK